MKKYIVIICCGLVIITLNACNQSKASSHKENTELIDRLTKEKENSMLEKKFLLFQQKIETQKEHYQRLQAPRFQDSKKNLSLLSDLIADINILENHETLETSEITRTEKITLDSTENHTLSLIIHMYLEPVDFSYNLILDIGDDTSIALHDVTLNGQYHLSQKSIIDNEVNYTQIAQNALQAARERK